MTTDLKDKLKQRAAQHRVLKYCNEEFLKENYFYFVLETTKKPMQIYKEINKWDYEDVKGDK